MSRTLSPWRIILWVERFLPAPKAPLASAAPAARRRAALVAPLVLMAIGIGHALSHLPELALVVRTQHVALAQAAAVIAGGIALAAVVAGACAWRDAKGLR